MIAIYEILTITLHAILIVASVNNGTMTVRPVRHLATHVLVTMRFTVSHVMRHYTDSMKDAHVVLKHVVMVDSWTILTMIEMMEITQQTMAETLTDCSKQALHVLTVHQQQLLFVLKFEETDEKSTMLEMMEIQIMEMAELEIVQWLRQGINAQEVVET